MTSSHSSGGIDRNGPTCVLPALLTRPSIRPKRSMTEPTNPRPPPRGRCPPRSSRPPSRPRARAPASVPRRRARSRWTAMVALGGGLGGDLGTDPTAAPRDRHHAVSDPLKRDLGRPPAGRLAAGADVDSRIASSVGSTVDSSDSPASTVPPPRTRGGRARAAAAGRSTGSVTRSPRPERRRSRDGDLTRNVDPELGEAGQCSAWPAGRWRGDGRKAAGPPSNMSTPRAPPSLSKLVWTTSRSSKARPASSRPRR